MGDERTNEVFIDDVLVHDDYVVGEVNKGFQYISEALDLERFTMFTFSPIKQRLDVLTDYVRTETVDGEPLRCGPGGASAHRPARHPGRGRPGAGAAVSSRRRRVAHPPHPPRVVASTSSTPPSCRSGSPTRRWNIGAPGSQLRVRTDGTPTKGRSESTYRYTVIDTIGGGASEIQKNIIARRKLGLPKNF